MIASQPSERRFVAVSTTLFVACATLTIVWCTPMSAMDGMPMPGGWVMSMTWTRMPGQTWGDATASFLLMWDVMMAAMMLPSLLPVLWRYRRIVRATDATHVELQTVLTGAGYFFAWNALGLLLFPLGVVFAEAAMQWPRLARFVPLMAGVVVLSAGALQFTGWKAHHLARCRDAFRHSSMLPAKPSVAWRQGVRLGLHCCLSCANLTAVLLVIGMMDPRAMVFITGAITAERLASSAERVARGTGLIIIGMGLILMTR